MPKKDGEDGPQNRLPGAAGNPGGGSGGMAAPLSGAGPGGGGGTAGLLSLAGRRFRRGGLGLLRRAVGLLSGVALGHLVQGAEPVLLGLPNLVGLGELIDQQPHAHRPEHCEGDDNKQPGRVEGVVVVISVVVRHGILLRTEKKIR